MGIEILRRIFKNYRSKLETEQVATEIVTTIKVIGNKLYKLLEVRWLHIRIKFISLSTIYMISRRVDAWTTSLLKFYPVGSEL